ncbi:hypothetical protein ACIQTZ_23220, partial [Paenarthrobacter sp. NPDC090520]|uniref:hypothetical protein n=1 Tax=Paenarthrobacter sp. NPDC090520 TaxID=3364382 RepID=UPI0037FF07D1
MDGFSGLLSGGVGGAAGSPVPVLDTPVSARAWIADVISAVGALEPAGDSGVLVDLLRGLEDVKS